MKRVLILAIFLIVTASALAQQPAAKSNSSPSAITGRVVGDGGQPIADASVTALPANLFGNQSAAMASIFRPIYTNADGRFEIKDLSSGAYTLMAIVPGYVAPSSREQKYSRPGDTVTISMIKGGVITGKVTSYLGEPVVGARVRATRIKDPEGRRVRSDMFSNSILGIYSAMFGEWKTDDRGIYRIYGLEPGTYTVAAGGKGLIPISTGGYDTDAPTYYPSGTIDAAAEVRVGGGDEVTGIDIRYRDNRGYSISGTATGGLGAEIIQVVLTHAASGALEGFAVVLPGEAKKGFIFNSVAEGDYYLTAYAGNAMEKSNGSASRPRRVALKGADVTGIELSLAPLATLAGRIQVEKAPAADPKSECKPTERASLEEIALVAQSDRQDRGRDEPDSLWASYSTSAPDEKGEFALRNLEPGRKHLVIKLPGERLRKRRAEHHPH